jgi:hypothetical protein
MPWDLDPLDVDELRRRAIHPVVASLVRPEELEEIEVTVDAAPSGLGNVWVRVRACGEWIPCTPAGWGIGSETRLWDAERYAEDLYLRLRDELVESTLSWGQWRDGDYQVLGPRES